MDAYFGVPTSDAFVAGLHGELRHAVAESAAVCDAIGRELLGHGPLVATASQSQ